MNILHILLSLGIAIMCWSCGSTEASNTTENQEGIDVTQTNNSGLPVVTRPEDAEIDDKIKPTFSLGGAIRITWEDLSKVSFTEKYFEEVGGNLLFPEFSEEVKSFAGKRVHISGYVIPVEPAGPDTPARYVLSANPFASCFFCGNAGPESVIELELKDREQLFYTDDYYSFVGKFSLNDSDINKLNYQLIGAAVFQEKKEK